MTPTSYFCVPIVVIDEPLVTFSLVFSSVVGEDDVDVTVELLVLTIELSRRIVPLLDLSVTEAKFSTELSSLFEIVIIALLASALPLLTISIFT